MKRLFITSRLEKALAMYNRTGYEQIKRVVENDFSTLEKEYVFNENKIIVLKDDFNDWGKFKINKESDFILYHASSSQDVINSISNTFKENHQKPGSHELKEPHDRVYRILFGSGNDKFNTILNILEFTDQEIEEKNILEAKLNLLHQCLTPKGAIASGAIENYDLIKELVKEVKWNEKTVVEHLAGQEDCFDEENYIKPLTKLRDALLS